MLLPELEDLVRGRGKKVKPVKDTPYGRELLSLTSKTAEPDIGGDFERAFVQAVAAGADYASAAKRFGISYEMAQYTVRRLIRRYDAMLKLAKGLKVLRAKQVELSNEGLTNTQREALVMLLAGDSQSDVALSINITQAAVSSRLRLASKLLQKVAEREQWAIPLAEAVKVRRSRNTLTTFQRKGTKS